jgi:hypothetical protein
MGIVAPSLFLCSLSLSLSLLIIPLSLQRHDLHDYRPFVLGYGSTFPFFNNKRVRFITNLCSM